jgi:hypothetical protein
MGKGGCDGMAFSNHSQGRAIFIPAQVWEFGVALHAQTRADGGPGPSTERVPVGRTRAREPWATRSISQTPPSWNSGFLALGVLGFGGSRARAIAATRGQLLL